MLGECHDESVAEWFEARSELCEAVPVAFSCTCILVIGPWVLYDGVVAEEFRNQPRLCGREAMHEGFFHDEDEAGILDDADAPLHDPVRFQDVFAERIPDCLSRAGACVHCVPELRGHWFKAYPERERLARERAGGYDL